MDSPRISIRREDPYSELATTLLAEMVAELDARYPDRDDDEASSFSPADVTGPRGAFIVATLDGEPVGCGALRPMTPEAAEMKRMYVREQARCLGVGGAMVNELERLARQFGYTTLRLETGVRQPEAMALYRRLGFTPIAPYAEYAGNPLSVCFGKDLSRG
jgi:putative acetyltransferase